MTSLTPVTEPAEHGFDAERLSDITLWARDYIDSGKLPCAMTLVTRRGEPVFLDVQGMADVANERPIRSDTIFRIYSMTKPITSVVAMMLIEEGRLSLDDEIATFIPAFAETPVLSNPKGTLDDIQPLATPMTVRHLMTHMSGLTYGSFDPTSPLAKPYAAGDFDMNPQGSPLEQWSEELARVPLMFQPGSRWNYGVSTDLLGRVIEIIEGRPLDGIFEERVLHPLGMNDTAFGVEGEKLERLASLYMFKAGGRYSLMESASESRNRLPVKRFQGGGGLVSTMADYFRLTEMFRRGGELGGVRLLKAETVADMTRNHLGCDIDSIGESAFSETGFRGVGFGLGFAVVLDPDYAGLKTSAGEFFWGGAASTAFWIDPERDISVIFMTQLFPSSQYPIRNELRALVDHAFMEND